MKLKCAINWITRWVIVASAAILLSGCGGGGSGGGTMMEEPPAQAPPPQQRAEVQTSQGLISGLLLTDFASSSLHQRVFKRVRYAAAPVGELRFKAPEPPPMIEGTYDASAFGLSCPQVEGGGVVGDEDCLFLNVWTHNDGLVRPVLLFLHGGGFVSGSASGLDGFWLAGNAWNSTAGSDVVVVTINYRLGALGFLAIDELIQENVRNTAGNWGLLDAIAALQWVRDNIGAFDGDPNRVMVFGHSSGASSICHLLAAPEAAGLFAAAAIQSGPCGVRFVLNDSVAEPSHFAPVVELQRPLLAEVGCDQAADVMQCLRDAPFAAITEAQARVPLLRNEHQPQDTDGTLSPFAAIIDGVVVQSNPYVALSDQTVGDIPIIVGGTRDEVFSSDVLVPDDDAYRNLLEATYPDPLDDQLYALYPTVEFPSARDAYLTLFGDAVINCVAEEMARSAQGGAPSYLYTLSHGFEMGVFWGPGCGSWHRHHPSLRPLRPMARSPDACCCRWDAISVGRTGARARSESAVCCDLFRVRALQ